MDAPLRVHVAHFGSPSDPDRIIKPALKGRADRLYLLTMKDPDLLAKKFDALCQRVKNNHVVDPAELRIRKCNFYNFNETMATNAAIIRDEQNAGNTVFYNVSTGGALLSIASILCCFLFGATPYYCKMDYKTHQVPDNPDLLDFPQYKIQYPDKETIQFLLKIRETTKSRPSKTLSKTECLEILAKLQPKKFQDKTSSKYNILKYAYLDKLESEGLIQVEKRTRGKVQLKGPGEFAVQLFSSFYGL